MADVNKKNDIMNVTTNGSISYASDVIAVIAGLAASEVAGVAEMAGSGIAQMLGVKNLGKGVKVIVEENTVALEMVLTVFYGVKIHEVAAAVQQNAIKAIENMTGLTVSKVNVMVQGIKFEKAEKTAIEDSEATE